MFCALALALAATAAMTGSADAHTSPADAAYAAHRGADWYEATQMETGQLHDDWGLTALAAVDVNAADVRTSLVKPSAQDFYLDEWQTSGPGGSATDAERGILAGVAGGIQTSRLSTAADTTTSNLVARVAEQFDGTQIGDTGLLNDDIFGVLALDQVGAPQPLLRRLADYLRTRQLADGGWSWSSSPAAPSDIDMTGAAVAAFCAAGIGSGDPGLERALALLHSVQDPATGGFVAPPESFGIGVNTDTTAWVTSGLIQCGFDPQGPEWTTDQGKTPLDYLVSMQYPDGHFGWTEEFDGFFLETSSAMRPLAGVAFSTPAPPRLDGVNPAVRPATAVAAGTTVPITLVIDHGPGANDVRMCRVDVESGSGLGAVLAAAKSASVPGDCVSQFATSSGAGGVAVDSLDGVAATPGYGWRVRVDGSPARAESDEPIGFGDLVFLQFAAKTADPGPAPKVTVPPVKVEKRRHRRGPRVAIEGEARWADGAIAVALSCPRGLGDDGCRGLLSTQFRKHRGGRLLAAGSTPYQVRSGAQEGLTIAATPALRQRLADGGRVKLRLTAATRAGDGAIRLTHAKRFIAG